MNNKFYPYSEIHSVIRKKLTKNTKYKRISQTIHDNKVRFLVVSFAITKNNYSTQRKT